MRKFRPRGGLFTAIFISGFMFLLVAAFAQEDPDKSISELSKDPEIVKHGAKLFQMNCASCHSPLLPPDSPLYLKKPVWIHGSKPTDIQTTITNGVPAKNMPAFDKTLKPEQIQSLVAYLLSIQPAAQPSASPAP
jgi:cytochrome c oxidase cbb3-type subunit 3